MGGGKYLICNDVIYPDDLYDYKFFCFDGKLKFVYGISDRNLGDTVQMGIYDASFNKLDVDRSDERHQEMPLPKPVNYDIMVDISEELAKGFPIWTFGNVVKIYFWRINFYDGGYFSFQPDKFDFNLENDGCSSFYEIEAFYN